MNYQPIDLKPIQLIIEDLNSGISDSKSKRQIGKYQKYINILTDLTKRNDVKVYFTGTNYFICIKDKYFDTANDVSYKHTSVLYPLYSPEYSLHLIGRILNPVINKIRYIFIDDCNWLAEQRLYERTSFFVGMNPKSNITDFNNQCKSYIEEYPGIISVLENLKEVTSNYSDELKNSGPDWIKDLEIMS